MLAQQSQDLRQGNHVTCPKKKQEKLCDLPESFQVPLSDMSAVFGSMPFGMFCSWYHETKQIRGGYGEVSFSPKAFTSCTQKSPVWLLACIPTGSSGVNLVLAFS